MPALSPRRLCSRGLPSFAAHKPSLARPQRCGTLVRAEHSGGGGGSLVPPAQGRPVLRPPGCSARRAAVVGGLPAPVHPPGIRGFALVSPTPPTSWSSVCLTPDLLPSALEPQRVVGLFGTSSHTTTGRTTSRRLGHGARGTALALCAVPCPCPVPAPTPAPPPLYRVLLSFGELRSFRTLVCTYLLGLVNIPRLSPPPPPTQCTRLDPSELQAPASHSRTVHSNGAAIYGER